MASSDPSRRALDSRLREAEPPVHYDVDAGLRRHRELVSAQANLPEWAGTAEVSRAALWLRWLGGLALLGGAGALLWSWPSLPAGDPQPRRPEGSEAAAASAPSSESAAESPPAAQSTAAVEPADQAGGLERPDEPQPLRANASDESARPASPAQAEAARSEQARRRRAPRPASEEGVRRHAPARGPARPTEGQTPEAFPGTDSAGTGSEGADFAGTGSAGQGSAAGGAGELHTIRPQDGEEIELLARARRMLGVDPLRALRLAREGEARFGKGYLRQERRYVEIQALRALGRDLEADALAGWFVQDYPDSPYAGRVFPPDAR